MDPVEQDTREYHDKLAKYNRAYEYMFNKVIQDETILEEMMMNEYPDYYEKIDDLSLFHKKMLCLCYNQIDISYVKKWLEYVEKEVERRLE